MRLLWEAMMTRHSIALVLSVFLVPANAQGQSWCRYEAHTPVEVTICGSDYLRRLDVRMSNKYSDLLNSLGRPDSLRLKADQLEWLNERNDCRADYACIADAYRRRIRELNQNY
jgi:uncharacterized protein